MDMNKYLLVAFYVVAGCTIASPAEGSLFANNSHQIWVELNTIIDENQVLLKDILREQDEPASIATLKSFIHKILSSFYILNNKSTYSDFLCEDEFVEYFYYQKPDILRHKNPSRQVRAPSLL